MSMDQINVLLPDEFYSHLNGAPGRVVTQRGDEHGAAHPAQRDSERAFKRAQTGNPELVRRKLTDQIGYIILHSANNGITDDLKNMSGTLIRTIAVTTTSVI
jgi:hypothetical protein